MSDQAPLPDTEAAKPAVDAVKEAAEKTAAAMKPWGERIKVGSARFGADAKNIFAKEATMGQRGVGFARVGAVAAGSYIALGALKSKDAEGNNRSGLVRVGQAVLGTGVAAAGVLVHAR